jgi:hypothetical protein
MRACAFAAFFGAALIAGCGAIPEEHVIPGPTAPSRVTTETPLVWDSRAELLDWVGNGVTRGPITVEGEGAAAFIRVKLDVGSLLRGPDLAPPVTGVRGARIRARLRHDRPRIPQWPQTEDVQMYFDLVNPVQPNTQSSMRARVPPSEEWVDLIFNPALYCCVQPLTVRYAYVPFFPTFPSTLEIDRIELTK